ncbi:EamA family transporter RarD [Sporosarcina contaminans]|uniref:EamA family transporter RarD n=1 Tax=Sporosarcina contaminans TaxID=633403 RepID=A0ABW3U2D2_9BACL
MQTEKKGVIFAAVSFIIWGIMPIYWKQIDHVQSDEILTGRILWAFVFTLIAVILMRDVRALLADFKDLWGNQKAFWSLFTASILVTSNWFIYIWAVNHEYIVQTSLGYYINPLASVLLGILFLKERLSRTQTAAVIVAAIGVLMMTISYGKFPWIAIALALTFALYGFIKKNIKLDAMRGLVIETMFMLPFAVGYYCYLFVQRDAAFLHIDWKTDLLLILTGIATALPLVLYAKGVQLIPLYVAGFIQYIAPTMMLFIGVILYKETFGKVELLSFSMIWAALILFTVPKLIAMTRRDHLKL